MEGERVGGGYKHPLLAASSLHFPAFTYPKVAHKDHLSRAASAPPLSPPGCLPHQSIPCQENERTPVLNGTLCVPGRARPALHSGTKASVNSIHGTTAPVLPKCTPPPLPTHIPPLPLLSLFPALLFFGVTPSYRALSEPETTEETKPLSRSTGRVDFEITTLYNFSPTIPTTQHTHTHTPSPSSYPHTLTPTHPPTSLLPPTCQTLLDIQKRNRKHAACLENVVSTFFGLKTKHRSKSRRCLKKCRAKKNKKKGS